MSMSLHRHWSCIVCSVISFPITHGAIDSDPSNRHTTAKPGADTCIFQRCIAKCWQRPLAAHFIDLALPLGLWRRSQTRYFERYRKPNIGGISPALGYHKAQAHIPQHLQYIQLHVSTPRPRICNTSSAACRISQIIGQLLRCRIRSPP